MKEPILNIIKLGGKQYIVVPNKKIIVDLLEANVGQKISVPLILKDGHVVNGETIDMEVLAHSQMEKILIQKKRRRKHSEKRTGFRRQVTELMYKEEEVK